MNAEIIAIGSELLTPQRVDTNSLFITDQLNVLGLEVTMKTIVGDDRARLTAVIAAGMIRSDVIILTGGLGPTEDDVTRDAVGAALGLGSVPARDCDPSEHLRRSSTVRQREWNRRGRLPDAASESPSAIRVLAPTAAGRASASPGASDGAAAPETPHRSLRQKLAAREFVVSVELDPPRGLNPRKALEGAAYLAALGADAINIGDSPMARVRMSAIALAVLIEQQVGIEPIIHFTSRDRNLMAIQSDLLGAHALGIRNVIALTGDPPSTGDYARATGVWDVDSIGFIRILKMLNAGNDWAGNSIGKGTDFFVACAANPTADNIDLELDRVRRKLEAGADALMTQQVYSADVLQSFLERLGPIDVPVLVGIMPLQSHRHTEFIHNELPGVFVPEDVRERMRLAGESGVAEGIAQARELLEACRPFVQGTYLVPSFGRYEVVGELVTLAKGM